jgi:DNA repair protein RadC
MDITRLDEESLLEEAARILESRCGWKGRETVGSPSEAGRIACLRLGSLEHEVFAVFWLDAQNRLIEFEQLFRGTLTQTSVYPREVAKSALRHNAAAAVLAHNHPSGCAEPSSADRSITGVLKSTLALLDVRLIDHLIVAGGKSASMAELGLV